MLRAKIGLPELSIIIAQLTNEPEGGRFETTHEGASQKKAMAGIVPDALARPGS